MKRRLFSSPYGEINSLRDPETGEIMAREVKMPDFNSKEWKSLPRKAKKERLSELNSVDSFDTSGDYYLHSNSILEHPSDHLIPEKNRLSRKIAETLGSDDTHYNLNQERISAKREYLKNRTDENYKKVKKIVEQRDEPVKRFINIENSLDTSGYDNKYSAKGVEKILNNRINSTQAKNIILRRQKKDSEYLIKDVEKGNNRDKFKMSDIGRRWNDAGLVYNEALGRNLNKDAAIAAGVTASLGASAYALHRHLKNKKKEKELVKDKYKTDSDKKKKK